MWGEKTTTSDSNSCNKAGQEKEEFGNKKKQTRITQKTGTIKEQKT